MKSSGILLSLCGQFSLFSFPGYSSPNSWTVPSQPHWGSRMVQALPQALCRFVEHYLGSPLFTSVNSSCHKVRLEPSLAPQSLLSDNLTNHHHSQHPLNPPLLSGATTTGHVTRTSGFLLYHLYPLHPRYSGNRHPVSFHSSLVKSM